MRGILTIVAAVAVALLLAGWALGDNCPDTCSNTGVKMVPDFALGDPNFYPINIPCCNNYTDLVSVFNDISSSAGCTAAQITSFNPDRSSCSWTGPFTCNRPLQCAEVPWVSTVGPCNGWVIVGANCASGSPLIAAARVITVVDPLRTFFGPDQPPCAKHMKDVFCEIALDCDAIGNSPTVAAVTHWHRDPVTGDDLSCSWTGAFTCNYPYVTGGGRPGGGPGCNGPNIYHCSFDSVVGWPDQILQPSAPIPHKWLPCKY